MDMEQIENSLADEMHVKAALGFQSLKSFTEFKTNALHGLIKFGDSFAIQLGLALIEAELHDAVKIIRYWHSLCEKHALLYQMYQAKDKALKEQGQTKE